MDINDNARPPVLAHQRFYERRSEFHGLSLAACFELIHKTNLWGAETSASGLGSERAAVSNLVQNLPSLMRRLKAEVILDAPCGDGGWIEDVSLGSHYIGLDIVPELIQRLAERASELGSVREYVLADLAVDPLPKADVILCRDCLVHLSFENIRLAVDNMKRSDARWLVTTTFTRLQHNVDCENGDWRALNFEREPFCWGRPVETLVEGCIEAEGGWADKSLGVWALNEV